MTTSMPSACGMTRMSEKMMAASSANLSMGCSVTLHASSGVRHTVKKSLFARSSRNSAGQCFASVSTLLCVCAGECFLLLLNIKIFMHFDLFSVGQQMYWAHSLKVILLYVRQCYLRKQIIGCVICRLCKFFLYQCALPIAGAAIQETKESQHIHRSSLKQFVQMP